MEPTKAEVVKLENDGNVVINSDRSRCESSFLLQLVETVCWGYVRWPGDGNRSNEASPRVLQGGHQQKNLCLDDVYGRGPSMDQREAEIKREMRSSVYAIGLTLWFCSRRQWSICLPEGPNECTVSETRYEFQRYERGPWVRPWTLLCLSRQDSFVADLLYIVFRFRGHEHSSYDWFPLKIRST